MTIYRCNPNKLFAGAGVNFDRMLNSLLTSQSRRTRESGEFIPRVDIFENDDNLILAAEIPGMDKSEIKIVVEDGILTISGEKKAPDPEDRTNVVRSELIRGKFSRSFTLPDYIESEKIGADYKNGVLSITMPKVEKVKPKEIEVNVN